MNKKLEQKLFALSVATMLVLTGCGGGGSGDSGRIDGGEGDQSAVTDGSDPNEGNDDASVPNAGTDDGSDVGSDQQTKNICSGEDSFNALLSGGFAPPNGATDVSATLNEATIRFNADVEPLTVSTNTVDVDGPTNFTLRAEDNRIVISFAEELEPEAAYTVLIDNIGTNCPNGIQFMENPVSFTFETGKSEGDVALLVEATSIDSVNQFIAQDSEFRVLFDAPIQEDSVQDNSVRIVPSAESSMQSGVPLRVTLSAEDPRLLEIVTLQPMEQQTSYDLIVESGLKGTEGQEVQDPVIREFRTQGFVTQLNRELITRIPGLGDGLNALASALFNAAGADASNNEGLNNLDNVAVVAVPLVGSVIDALTDFSENPGNVSPENLANLVENAQSDGVDSLIAVCDPMQPADACVLSLDLGLSSQQLADLGNLVSPQSLTDPADTFLAITNLAAALDLRDADNVPLELDLKLLDSALIETLPGELSGSALDGLEVISSAFDAVPVIGEFLNLQGNNSLAQLSLFRDGALVTLNGSDVLGAIPLVDVLNGSLPEIDSPLAQLYELINLSSVDRLPGFNYFPGESDLSGFPILGELLGVLGDGGSLQEPGFTLEDVPLVGDILTTLLGSMEDEGLLSEVPLVGGILDFLRP